MVAEFLDIKVEKTEGTKNQFCQWYVQKYATKISYLSTVELGFKNLLEFKNQITNYQLVIYVVNYSQDKNILDFKNQNGSDRKSS